MAHLTERSRPDSPTQAILAAGRWRCVGAVWFAVAVGGACAIGKLLRELPSVSPMLVAIDWPPVWLGVASGALSASLFRSTAVYGDGILSSTEAYRTGAATGMLTAALSMLFSWDRWASLRSPVPAR